MGASLRSKGSNELLLNLTLGLSLLLVLNACSRKPDVKAEAAALQQELARAAPSGPTAQDSTSATAAALAADLKSYGSYVVSAVSSNDYAGSVIALEAMQRISGITAEQRAAVLRAKAAITADLMNRADRGDPKALAELKAIEKTHSQ